MYFIVIGGIVIGVSWGLYKAFRWLYSALFGSSSQEAPAADVEMSPVSLESKLVKLCELFNDFASTDALNFEGCVCMAAYRNDPTYGEFSRSYVDQILHRYDGLNSEQKDLIRRSSLVVLPNQLTREGIEAMREKIEKAHGGACTNLAIAAVGRIMNSFKGQGYEPHIEVVARQAGRGSHIFVLVNRNPNSELNNTNTWNDDCYIVDPWAQAMGYSKIIYNGKEYDYGSGVYKKETYPYSGMLQNLKSIFDNNTHQNSTKLC